MTVYRVTFTLRLVGPRQYELRVLTVLETIPHSKDPDLDELRVRDQHGREFTIAKAWVHATPEEAIRSTAKNQTAHREFARRNLERAIADFDAFAAFAKQHGVTVAPADTKQ